jgi:hypothetical protein
MYESHGEIVGLQYSPLMFLRNLLKYITVLQN